ncbi:MAG: Bro-N domain-containing protein [Candidatus Phlomobacter fragariae]
MSKITKTELMTVKTDDLGIEFRLYPKGIILVPEADLYRLILKSKLSSAERVQDWVCKEILPALHQHGSYSIKKSHKDEGSGLPEFRKAKEIEIQAKTIQIQMDNAERMFESATHLSDNARQ